MSMSLIFGLGFAGMEFQVCRYQEEKVDQGDEHVGTTIEVVSGRDEVDVIDERSTL